MKMRELDGQIVRPGWWIGVVMTVGFMLGAPKAMTAAQSPGNAAMAVTPCTLDKGIYTCSWTQFEKTLAAAKTAAVQSEPMDEYTDSELAKLVKRLGKTVVARDETPSDLTFLLIPLNDTGVYMGPGDQEMSTLRVYSGGTKTHRGKLVWAERYRGPSDMAWPVVVHYTIAQFEARLKRQ